MTNKPKTLRAITAREKRLQRCPTMIAENVLEVSEDETQSIGHQVSDNDPVKMAAAAGWDVYVEVQGEPGWNCDSGYESDIPDPEPAPLSAEAVKYQALPSRTAYYFHTYATRIMEACCLKYARTHLAANLSDFEWKRRNLLFENPQYPDDHWVFRDWLAEDQIELEIWMRFFEQFRLHYGIRNAVIYLRNAAIHRWDRENLNYEKFSPAMKFPAFLKDGEAEAEIKNAFAYVMEDPTLDSDATARVEAAMYAPRPPCTTDCQLLSQIQTLIEESCFNHARREIPHVLATKGWEIPEQVELPEWCLTYDDARVRHDKSANDIFPYLDDISLRNHMYEARRDIRNPAAHYGPVSIDKFVRAIHGAIRTCILQADWRRAIEVEVLAESYFTQSSRALVLDRLESTYRAEPIKTAYERGRRAAICRVLEDEGRAQGDVLGIVEGLGIGDPEMRWVERTWSPSMDGCLKRKEEEFE